MYFICYSTPEEDLHEVIAGEESMKRRVHELMLRYDLGDDDIHVFREEDSVI